MPIPTKPQELGAPLDPEVYPASEDHTPTRVEISAELTRAEIELMHAVARHRKAWARMRKHGETAKEKAVWAEGYAPYKEAVSDVRWWREEMAAQAATVTALLGMLELP